MQADEALRRTVLLNATRGNQLFNEDAAENDTDIDLTTTKCTYLFMVNRSTEFIGQYLKSDFAILRLSTDIENSNRNSPQSQTAR